MTQAAANHTPTLHEVFLSELLLGSYMSHAEILNMSKRLHYTLERRSFYCTLLTPQNLSQSLALKNGMSRYELFHYAAQQLGVFCRQQSTVDFQLVSAPLHRELAVLISIPNSQSEKTRQGVFSQYIHTLGLFLEQLEQTSGLQLRAATSSLQPDIDSIPITYAQAKELEGFIVMLSLADRNLTYDSVVVNGWEIYDEAHLVAANRWESAFLNSLERNDFHRLQELLHEMAEHEFQYGHITIQTSTALLHHMLNKIRIVLDCMRAFAGPDVLAAFETAPRILYRKSVAEVMESMDLIFSTFFDGLEHTGQKKLPLWLSRMDAYIVDNFIDPDLNVSTVSEHFGLCAAYAGRLYKTHFGFSVLDRINHLRIQRANELMQQNMLLKDIAVMVGYENRHRMNRAFLKYVGYTPAEARAGLMAAPQTDTQ